VVPLREPASVSLRARLRAGVQPSEIQKMLDDAVTVPTRSRPHIGLEEVDAEEVVVRIAATPESSSDGSKLADEILAAVGRLTTGEHVESAPKEGAQRDVSGQHRPAAPRWQHTGRRG
jgi:hypothetical protein